MAQYTGTIKRIRFYNEVTKYVVAVVQLEKSHQEIVISGKLDNPNSHVMYVFFGEFDIHEKYGKQLVFSSYKKLEHNSSNNVVSFLAGPLFQGINTAIAKKIVTILGDQCLRYIISNGDVLDAVEDLGEKKKNIICSVINQNSEYIDLVLFLLDFGMPLTHADIIFYTYGKNAVNIIKNNAYQLVDDIETISFDDADALATKIDNVNNDYSRVMAAIRFVITNYSMKSGSSYITKDMLIKKLKTMVAYTEGVFEEHVLKLVEDRKIVVVNHRYYSFDMYVAEKQIAQFISNLIKHSKNNTGYIKINDEIKKLEIQSGIKYGNRQKEAISCFIKSPCMILTGGPGTGKTTVVKGIIDLYKTLFPNKHIALVAPTGRAAKRLNELTGVKSTTIHSLLRWDVQANNFVYNDENPIGEDILIIDEASMVDTILLWNLLKASRFVSKILFIGDHNQLPSVMSGNVLYDLMHSNIDTVVLDEIYRQDENSGIIPFSYQILHEQVESLSILNKYEDLFFYQCIGQGLINNLLKITKGALAQGYTANDIQVLAPMYQGTTGINALNNVLQSVFNPPNPNKVEYSVGSKVFRQGDKVLLLKNRPENDVYNGDIGILKAIHFRDGVNFKYDTFVIRFDEIDIIFNSKEFSQISHAYCMSVHKAQGSEFKIVIMTVLDEHLFMLKRTLFYTGMTRAKEMLFILGQESAVLKAIYNIDNDSRKTGLIDRFNEENSF